MRTNGSTEGLSLFSFHSLYNEPGTQLAEGPGDLAPQTLFTLLSAGLSKLNSKYSRGNFSFQAF